MSGTSIIAQFSMPLITPSRMYLVARNSTLLKKGADQPAHPRSQLALESMLHAKNEN